MSATPPHRRRFTPLLSWLVAASVLCTGCGGEGEPIDAPSPAVQSLPTSIEIVDPDPRITHLETVEDLSEEVADWLLDYSDKLLRREFGDAREWLAPDFAGLSLGPLSQLASESLTAGAHRVTFDPGTAVVVGPDEFMRSIESHIADWSRVETVLWKVKGAEFRAGGGVRTGKIKLYLSHIGTLVGGGRAYLSGWAYCTVEKRRGTWMITRFRLDALQLEQTDRAWFTDVSTSTGVAHRGTRFGKPGNQSFAWNGAAGGDVNGDGYWDVFVPSDQRNFLYLGGPEGVFEEVAEQRGVAHPPAGTGAVFFDHDGDGDQDLLVGHDAWVSKQGQVEGRAPAFYENDGKGQFTERGKQLGLDRYLGPWYSLCVLDHDADGDLDVFVCGYGAVAKEHNNSWIEATNGTPNLLLENRGSDGFVDVAGELGIAGNSWSYAAAAADYDNDGDVDLYVANDYGTNRLWTNDGAGRFSDAAGQLGVKDKGNGMGVTWGDLNQDGLLDLYVSNMSSTAGNRILGRLQDDLDPELHATLKKLAAGNTIFLSSAESRFRRLPSSAGGVNASWAWSAVLRDFDLDGCLDIYCANGYVTGDLAHDT
jgi:VCBS repeat protein